MCSGYTYYAPNPQLYWQSCAWADNNEVYFTVHLGNASNSDWNISVIGVDYYKSGVFHPCGTVPDFVVRAHSIRQTLSTACVLHRTRAAYQSVGFVSDEGFIDDATSDTLQVQ